MNTTSWMTHKKNLKVKWIKPLKPFNPPKEPDLKQNPYALHSMKEMWSLFEELPLLDEVKIRMNEYEQSLKRFGDI